MCYKKHIIKYVSVMKRFNNTGSNHTVLRTVVQINVKGGKLIKQNKYLVEKLRQNNFKPSKKKLSNKNELKTLDIN